MALPALPALDGFRTLVLFALLLPLVWIAIERHVARLFPDPEAGGETSHGRDYYIGYTVGREVFRGEDVDDVVRLMQRESIGIKIEKDDGGEKVFLARELPATRGKAGHELEAGLLSGALHRSLNTRFEVDEERCVRKGDGYCRFVAIRG